MKKLFLTTVMLFGVYIYGQAQTITLPTVKRTKTTEVIVKQKKNSSDAGANIPVLPTTTTMKESDDVSVTTSSIADSDLPSDIRTIIVKRHNATRAKAIKRNPKANDKEIYESAEHIPTYPGGAAALMKFIQDHLQYPEDAKAEKAEGIVKVSFVVEKDGSTSDFEVLDEHHPSLEAEAVRVLRMMPKWNPGTQDGVKVRVEYCVPVKFVLPQEEMNE